MDQGNVFTLIVRPHPEGWYPSTRFFPNSLVVDGGTSVLAEWYPSHDCRVLQNRNPPFSTGVPSAGTGIPPSWDWGTPQPGLGYPPPPLGPGYRRSGLGYSSGQVTLRPVCLMWFPQEDFLALDFNCLPLTFSYLPHVCHFHRFQMVFVFISEHP